MESALPESDSQTLSSKPDLSLIDKKILNVLQTDFPVSVRPFRKIGSELGITEEEVSKKNA